MTPEGSVCDRTGGLSYAAIRDSSRHWGDWLDARGISRRHCLLLPLRNEARSVAAMLALIEIGQSLLLWRRPPAVEGDVLTDEALPPFCRAALLMQDAAPGTAGPAGMRLALPAAQPRRRLPDASYVYVTTSGSTGRPKLVAFKHGTLVANARNCIERLGLSSTDRVLIPVPVAHMYGLGAALLPAFLTGAAACLVPDANLLGYLQAEAAFEPNVSFLTPSFCGQLVKGRKQSRSYRLTILAGDAAEEATFTAYETRHGPTINLYGSTELGVIAAGSADEPFSARRDTVGRPVPEVQVRGGDAAMSSGEPFPLAVEHPYGCAGYADEDGLPAKPETLFQNGVYLTQDLGRLDAEGRLVLAGRFDDSVKRDGMLVAFVDVERALQRIDSVEKVVVVRGGRTPRGTEMVAVCTLLPGAAATATSLRRTALTLLPAYAVPDRFVILDALPQTATAKPDRAALTALVS